MKSVNLLWTSDAIWLQATSIYCFLYFCPLLSKRIPWLISVVLCQNIKHTASQESCTSSRHCVLSLWYWSILTTSFEVISPILGQSQWSNPEGQGWYYQIDGLVQDCNISFALAMEILQSSTKALKLTYKNWYHNHSKQPITKQFGYFMGCATQQRYWNWFQLEINPTLWNVFLYGIYYTAETLGWISIRHQSNTLACFLWDILPSRDSQIDDN